MNKVLLEQKMSDLKTMVETKQPRKEFVYSCPSPEAVFTVCPGLVKLSE